MRTQPRTFERTARGTRSTSQRPRGQESTARRAKLRRRGSVLVLVMTLLGILFVTGIAFLASMQFQADMIDVTRQQKGNTESVAAAEDVVSTFLHDGTVGLFTSAPGGALSKAFERDDPADPSYVLRRKPGDSVDAMGELPGVHGLTAPIEPYANITAVPPQLRYRWFTNLSGLRRGIDYSPLGLELAANVAGQTVDAQGLQIDWNNDGNPDYVPTDADGDGVVDSVQVDLAKLGYSRSQIAAIAETVNPPGLREATAYLGLRVVSHGGMVNINDSHPTLLENVLEVPPGTLTVNPPFRHRPSLDTLSPDYRERYRPTIEEPLLRRRGFLPPRVIPMSLLEGNAWSDPSQFPEGYADLASFIYPPNASTPTGYDRVFEGDHRYEPYIYAKEMYDPNLGVNSPRMWDVRMNPTVAAQFVAQPQYDLRHLLTTVSYDDLLSRGGRAKSYKTVVGSAQPIVAGDVEMRTAMRDTDKDLSNKPIAPTCDVPFEYPYYPFQLPPQNANCACPNDPNDANAACRPKTADNSRVLSLPWLDEVCERYKTDPAKYAVCLSRRQRLIHDVFMMLVNNARGQDWEEIGCRANFDCPNNGVCKPVDPTEQVCIGGSDDGRDCVSDADCVGTGLTPGRCMVNKCYDPTYGQSHRMMEVSRAAASLTANFLDYMDADDIPTQVPLRSFDFSDPANVGKPMTAVTGLTPPPYVYGLERQPYITEIGTVVEGNGDPNPGQVAAYAIELYNPYGVNGFVVGGDQDNDSQTDYWITNDKDFATPSKWVEWKAASGTYSGDEAFTVIASNISAVAPLAPIHAQANRRADPKLNFDNGGTIYLIRRVTYPQGTVDIVVDQYLVDHEVAKSKVGNPPAATTFYSSDRDVFPANATWPTRNWKAVVPVTSNAALSPTLGDWNEQFPAAEDFAIRPVVVDFANAGRFTARTDTYGNFQSPGSFPTTGSMLMLMRHANRSLADAPAADLAFTAHLERHPDKQPKDRFDSVQIDNGRLPIFDPIPTKRCVGGSMHGNICTDDTQCLQWFCLPGYSHHIDPMRNPPDDPLTPRLAKPGRLSELPWGQLVFDYFTVLPLENDSPYANRQFSIEYPRPDALPRVDEDGLRVSGRININEAPWTVLSGLPLIPANRLPAGLIPDTTQVLIDYGGLQSASAARLGNELAQGIAAYRDASMLTNTGDYSNGTLSRGWESATPRVRRGTGFLSVGELANVRNLDATPKTSPPLQSEPPAASAYRIDDGMVSLTGYNTTVDELFLAAAAKLIALQDWATTRSHVFTVYGTLRGERDDLIVDPVEQARDVDERAIRFQETIDRFPMLQGADEVTRIGHLYQGAYLDAQQD